MNAQGKNDAHILGVLEAVSARSDVSQRRLAEQLGVALGLANSYLRSCARKGWIKVNQVPGNRYLYYLTTKGFAEKSRLSADCLSYSLGFYRKAGTSCLENFDTCYARGWRRLALCGISELAEIALVRSQERDIEIGGFVDPDTDRQTYLGRPVFRQAGLARDHDAYLVTDLDHPVEVFERLSNQVDAKRVLIPSILDWRPPQGANISQND